MGPMEVRPACENIEEAAGKDLADDDEGDQDDVLDVLQFSVPSVGGKDVVLEEGLWGQAVMTVVATWVPVLEM